MHTARIGAVQPEIREQRNHAISLPLCARALQRSRVKWQEGCIDDRKDAGGIRSALPTPCAARAAIRVAMFVDLDRPRRPRHHR
jgi:hypothetical protein